MRVAIQISKFQVQIQRQQNEDEQDEQGQQGGQTGYNNL